MPAAAAALSLRNPKLILSLDTKVLGAKNIAAEAPVEWVSPPNPAQFLHFSSSSMSKCLLPGDEQRRRCYDDVRRPFGYEALMSDLTPIDMSQFFYFPRPQSENA